MSKRKLKFDWPRKDFVIFSGESRWDPGDALMDSLVVGLRGESSEPTYA